MITWNKGKPTKPGIYRTRCGDDDGSQGWRNYWGGREWSCGWVPSDHPDTAVIARGTVSPEQSGIEWQELAR